MAGHGHAGPRQPHTFHPGMPGIGHRWGAKLLGAGMWFFIFYRFREDGPALLGWRHPWEGEHH